MSSCEVCGGRYDEEFGEGHEGMCFSCHRMAVWQSNDPTHARGIDTVEALRYLHLRIA